MVFPFRPLFDRKSPRQIQSPRIIFLLLCIVVAGGCNDEVAKTDGMRHERTDDDTEQAGHDGDGSSPQAGVPSNPAEEKPIDGGLPVDSDTAGQEASAAGLEIGPVRVGDTIVVRAVGRVRKSADIGLARQAAAARARKKLQKLLADRGYDMGPEGAMPETTIEKYYKKGKHLYAVARCEVPVKKPVNVSDRATSKAPVNETGTGAGTQPAGPQGGKK